MCSGLNKDLSERCNGHAARGLQQPISVRQYKIMIRMNINQSVPLNSEAFGKKDCISSYAVSFLIYFSLCRVSNP